MIRQRRARMIATIGPASRAPDRVLALARAGVDVFRVNFSHAKPDDYLSAQAAIRAAETALERPLAILADLQGPKLRLGRFAAGKADVPSGAAFRLDLDPAAGDDKRVQVPHPELFAALRNGAVLLVDDGKVRLRVKSYGRDFAEVVAVQGGVLSDNKGVALPGAPIPIPALTEKDRADLAFALRHEADWIALSFVQRPADMAELRQIVQGRAAVMAKIEKPAALRELDEILDLCDGVMIARGDLGVELEPEEVPVAQKAILRAARGRGVPVVVATQMLESMITSPTPTRAEASDVANAVYEGADALMLSAESASGQFPLEAVTMMNRIIERVERDPRWPGLMGAEHGDGHDDADMMVAAAKRAAEVSDTNCLIAYTFSGATARRLSRERPLQPIVALTPNPATARRLALVWGLEPRVAAEPSTIEEMTAEALEVAMRLNLVEPMGRVLIVAGTPFGAPGSTNLLRLAHAPL